MPSPTRQRRAQMVLDMRGVVDADVVPDRQERSGRETGAVQGVSLGAEDAARERRSASAALATATRGMVRERCAGPGGSCRYGIRVIRHMLPFWTGPVDDLLEMVEMWVAGANRIYEENEP